MRLIDAVVKHAKHHNADHVIFASHSHDPDHNPLSHSKKLSFAKKLFPHANFYSGSGIKTPIDAMKHLHKRGYKHVTFLVGADRHSEFNNLLHKYNGKDYHFHKLEVKSAGDRDPDSEGIKGMSASKMREAARSGNFKRFYKGVPNKEHAKDLYKAVRKGMKLEAFSPTGKALFLLGGPGSGKDFIINSALGETCLKEIPLDKLYSAIQSKTDLEELSEDYSLVINGNAERGDQVILCEKVLKCMGYDTAALFVYTTNESSKKRNDARALRGAKTYSEEQRIFKYQQAVKNLNEYNEHFEDFWIFDNSAESTMINEDVNGWLTELGEKLSNFFESKKSKPAWVKHMEGPRVPPQAGGTPATPHKSILKGYKRVQKDGRWVLVPEESNINNTFETYTATAVDNSQGNTNVSGNGSPTENPATVMAKVRDTRKITPTDKQAGISIPDKNMAAPPVWETMHMRRKGPVKKNETKSMDDPPQFFDSRMGQVPSGSLGITGEYKPTGRSLSEIRKGFKK